MISVVKPGVVEIHVEYPGLSLYVPIEDIICVRRSHDSTPDSEICKIQLVRGKGYEAYTLYDRDYIEGNEEVVVPYVTIMQDPTVVRMAIREAYGMTKEQVSSQMGMELLGKLP